MEVELESEAMQVEPEDEGCCTNTPMQFTCELCPQPQTFIEFKNYKRHVQERFAYQARSHTAQDIAVCEAKTAQQCIDPRRFHLQLREQLQETQGQKHNTEVGEGTHHFPGKQSGQSGWTTDLRKLSRQLKIDYPTRSQARSESSSLQFARHYLFHNESLGPLSMKKQTFSALRFPRPRRKAGNAGWRADRRLFRSQNSKDAGGWRTTEDPHDDDGRGQDTDNSHCADEADEDEDEAPPVSMPVSEPVSEPEPTTMQMILQETLKQQVLQLVTMHKGPLCLLVSTDPATPTFVMQNTTVYPHHPLLPPPSPPQHALT